jgi:formate-dependent nitrite reductase membrane component NrfD
VTASYYGRPILKPPVWKADIPWYFFLGGMSGAANALAFGARRSGNEILARRLHLLATAGVAAGPALLIHDLGRPHRFLNMLRTVKVTSPMSIGTWVLAAGGAATGTATALDLVGRLPRVRAAAEAGAALLGLPMSTYTAALVAQSAIPVWHEARRELPFVFAASSAASAGAAGMVVTPAAYARPARRLAVLGGLAELAAVRWMERRLGSLLAEPYHQGQAARYAKLARASTATGTAVAALVGSRRAGAAAGGALLLAGSALERWAVFKAGFQGAQDPKYVVEPQRARLRRRDALGGRVDR